MKNNITDVIRRLQHWKLVEVVYKENGTIIWRACGKTIRIDQVDDHMQVRVDGMVEVFATDLVKIEVRM